MAESKTSIPFPAERLYERLRHRGLHPMTDEEFGHHLDEVGRIAKAQKEGPYTPQSDAVQALELIEMLVLLLLATRKPERP